eukprot:gene12422-16660_t
MSVSIKVAIRCRPFTEPDRLGVKLRQISEELGEVELINSDYTTSRFPFTYAWWSANGYNNYLQGDNMPEADDMTLINQETVYESCGTKIKADLLGGNAVVLFAYGLSGSGKTYTVFGPDAIDAPDAWFRHKDPHKGWGIFPRLAYEIFLEKKDGWKISMKYFQNVCDIVRDLMSPNGEEQHYKSGMRKDSDGFMDIDWCGTKIINSWNEFREQFQIANARKAIAPTQFNAMSTRGHCILVFEVEMPHPEVDGMKQKGRVYICDLAGTEPAGDIVFAQYKKTISDDGSIDFKYIGPHQDQNKTKELQEQGKKINLSLSEMAQFFMKMAEAVVKKKLKPGMSIPGCNSFFLCKYLKDTMLQARTYLFCAIRPEVTFLKYTFATLGFAKNASVVKLTPKKATVASSPNERKLMAELESMRELVLQLQTNQSNNSNSLANNAYAEQMIFELQQRLAEKQNDLALELNNQASNSHNNDHSIQQREEFSKRGISLVAYDGDCREPYFINLEDDAFRSNRFMYILKKEITIFGIKGDIQLMSLSVLKEHCKVKFDGMSVFIIGGKGDTWHNGKIVAEGMQEKVEIFDRIAIGDQLMMLRWHEQEYSNELLVEPMSACDAVAEYHEGLVNNRKTTGNENSSIAHHQIANQLNLERKRIIEEREKWENEKSTNSHSNNQSEQYKLDMIAVDNMILDLLPKVKEAKQTVDLMNRINLTFDVVLEKGIDDVPIVKIHVENSNPKLSILLEPADFLTKLGLLKDEMMKLRNSIDMLPGREYTIPERHDPLYLLFDNDFFLGSGTHWTEYLIYNLTTEEEECLLEVKSSVIPYDVVGKLEIRWIPLVSPHEDEDINNNNNNSKAIIYNSEDIVLGKSWTYKLIIRRAIDLAVFCDLAYISYDFLGETFVTEAVQQTTFSPIFDYEQIHHVPFVSKEFIQYLKGSFDFHVHVYQHVDAPNDKIGTNNRVVVNSILSGEPKGYELINEQTAKNPWELKCEQLQLALAYSNEQIMQLTNKNIELELKLSQLINNKGKLKTSSKQRNNVLHAMSLDSMVNGSNLKIDDDYYADGINNNLNFDMVEKNSDYQSDNYNGKENEVRSVSEL